MNQARTACPLWEGGSEAPWFRRRGGRGRDLLQELLGAVAKLLRGLLRALLERGLARVSDQPSRREAEEGGDDDGDEEEAAFVAHLEGLPRRVR
jgi:hypothetical protein